MINRRILGAVFFLALALPRVARAADDGVLRKTLANGDRIQYDGAYYDFRSKDGIEMVKLWVPPGQKLRGIFISGHGGGTGDSREFSRYDSLKGFAARIGFGLAGLHNFPGRYAYEKGAPLFFKVLDAWAGLGKHPELANVPFAMYGSSNGGGATYGFVNAAPKRALCFLSNVSASFNPPEPGPDVLEVPGIIIIGMFDGAGRGIVPATKQVRKARALGARWSLVVEQKGHEDGVSFDLYMKLVERALALRYPADLDPSRGPIALKSVPEESGWLADLDTFGSGITTVAAYADYKGDRKTAGWLLDRDLAYTYQAASSWDSPVSIQIKDVNRVANPHIDPATMFAIGGPVVDQGKRVEVSANVADFPEWQRIEFYDGAIKLGEVRAPHKPTIRFQVDRKRAVQTLSALAYDRQGNTRAALPFHFFIRDPKVSTVSDSERARAAEIFHAPAVAAGSSSGAGQGAELRKEGKLVAYGLTERQEGLWGKEAGRPAALWDELPGDAVLVDRKNSGVEGSPFMGTHSGDIELAVKAAHSRKGVYLYFKVTDNRFVDTLPEAFNGTDAVEVLIDPRSSKAINDLTTGTEFVNEGWGLTLTNHQYQVATGGTTWPTVMRRNLPDPWDMAYRTVTLANAAKQHGIEIRYSKLGRMYRVQEWFLPWSELSGGSIQAEPPVGTELALAISYNDVDAADGGVKRLRWIDKKGPWRAAGPKGIAPRGWGDLVVGPTPGDRPTTAATAK